MRYIRQRGGLTLELALASLGVAFFIVGVSDLARIFQARGAIQAAVQEGLRCVSPLDAACGASNVTSGHPPSPILFDVWVGRTSRQYGIPQEYVTASAQWSSEQVWRAQYETTPVQSISIDRPQGRYLEQEVTYPVDAHAVYLVQTRGLPRIGGSEPLAPVFLSPNGDQQMLPNKRVGLRDVRGATRQRAPMDREGVADYYAARLKIGEVSFSLAEAWRGNESLSSIRELLRRYNADLRCYAGPLSQRADALTVAWELEQEPQPCQYARPQPEPLFDGSTLKVPLMMRVSGETAGTEAGQESPGVLVIRATWSSPTGGTGSFELGGRRISEDSSGDLVVRGASWSDLTDVAKTAHRERGYAREIDAYGTLDLLPIDAQVTLAFFLSSASGERVAWRGGALQIFFPTFQVTKESFACGGSPDPQRCINPPQHVPVTYVALNQDKPIALKPIGKDLCRVEPPKPFEKDPSRLLDSIQRDIRAGSTPTQRRFWTLNANAAGCSPVTTTYKCSAALQKSSLRGCQAEEWSQAELLKGCAGGAADLRDGATLRVTYGTPVPGKYELVGECSGPQLPSCALMHREQVGRAVLATDVACATKVMHVPVAERFGPYLTDTCAPATYAAQVERYRAKHGVPSGVAIQLASSPAPEHIQRAKPHSSCQVAREIAVREEVSCGAGVSSAAVEGCCREAEGDCRYLQSRGVSASTGSAALQVAFNQAIGRTVETMQAAFPAANYNTTCTDGQSYCLEVAAQLVDNNARARLSAQVRVPLTLLQAVGWQGTTVSYAESRVLERARIATEDFVN